MSKKKSRFYRFVTWIQETLAANGIGKFSRRAVKIGLAVTVVLAVLVVANILTRQVEPAVERAFGAALFSRSPAPAQAPPTNEIIVRLDQLAVGQESLRHAINECKAQPKQKPAQAQRSAKPAKTAARDAQDGSDWKARVFSTE